MPEHRLIPVVSQVIDHQSVQTVDARTLHTFLEVGKDFSTWIKDRIEQYSFEQGKDFEVFCSPESVSKDSEGRGGHNRKDYALTLDMAKELAMVERTPKGKQARQYFIECERQLIRGDTAPIQSISKSERELQALARDTMRTLKAFGITGNAAVISCDQYCQKILGRGLLSNLGQTHLLADPRGRTYTPTELGKMCDPPLSAIKMNLALESAGFQSKELGEWIPTDQAAGEYEWLDTGKRHSTGAPVKQPRWFPSILSKMGFAVSTSMMPV